MLPGCDDMYLFIALTDKLNSLPGPQAPRVVLRPLTGDGQITRVRYEADTYFFLFESYPTDVAMAKLNQLLGVMGNAFVIESVTLTGSVDPIEQKVKGAALARARAERVKDYLQSAGLDSGTHIVVQTREPKSEDTPEGRARDRVTEIVVQALIRRPIPK